MATVFNITPIQGGCTNESEGSQSSPPQRGGNQKKKPLCARCRNHGIHTPLYQHRGNCQYMGCTCSRCNIINSRRLLCGYMKQLDKGTDSEKTPPIQDILMSVRKQPSLGELIEMVQTDPTAVLRAFLQSFEGDVDTAMTKLREQYMTGSNTKRSTSFSFMPYNMDSPPCSSRHASPNMTDTGETGRGMEHRVAIPASRYHESPALSWDRQKPPTLRPLPIGITQSSDAQNAFSASSSSFASGFTSSLPVSIATREPESFLHYLPPPTSSAESAISPPPPPPFPHYPAPANVLQPPTTPLFQVPFLTSDSPPSTPTFSHCSSRFSGGFQWDAFPHGLSMLNSQKGFRYKSSFMPCQNAQSDNLVFNFPSLGCQNDTLQSAPVMRHNLSSDDIEDPLQPGRSHGSFLPEYSLREGASDAIGWGGFQPRPVPIQELPTYGFNPSYLDSVPVPRIGGLTNTTSRLTPMLSPLPSNPPTSHAHPAPATNFTCTWKSSFPVNWAFSNQEGTTITHL